MFNSKIHCSISSSNLVALKNGHSIHHPNRDFIISCIKFIMNPQYTTHNLWESVFMRGDN